MRQGSLSTLPQSLSRRSHLDVCEHGSCDRVACPAWRLCADDTSCVHCRHLHVVGARDPHGAAMHRDVRFVELWGAHSLTEIVPFNCCSVVMENTSSIPTSSI